MYHLGPETPLETPKFNFCTNHLQLACLVWLNWLDSLKGYCDLCWSALPKPRSYRSQQMEPVTQHARVAQRLSSRGASTGGSCQAMGVWLHSLFSAALYPLSLNKTLVWVESGEPCQISELGKTIKQFKATGLPQCQHLLHSWKSFQFWTNKVFNFLQNQ